MRLFIKQIKYEIENAYTQWKEGMIQFITKQTDKIIKLKYEPILQYTRIVLKAQMKPILESQSQQSICSVCKLEPLPQSTQYLPLIIIQLILILVSLKISLIVLLIGYFFSKTIWVCPMCKRQVNVNSEKTQSTKQYIIIRLNDFMLLISKLKFRIIAVVLIAGLAYWYINQPSYQYKPRVKIEKTWKSIVTNCGYDSYLDNSFKCNYLYSFYQDTNNWNLQGVFLEKLAPKKAGYSTYRIKMIPTQFRDQNTEDIQVLFKETEFSLERGDVIKFKGEWSGKRQHVLIFLANSIQKADKKITNFLQEIQIMTHGSLREHPQ